MRAQRTRKHQLGASSLVPWFICISLSRDCKSNFICNLFSISLFSDGFNVRGSLERNLKGGGLLCSICQVGGQGHLLESCFTAFLRRAAFTAYFEVAIFAAFFRGAALWHFLLVDQRFLTFFSLPNPYVILHDFVDVNGDNYGLKRFFLIFSVLDLFYLCCWTLSFFPSSIFFFFFLVFVLCVCFFLLFDFFLYFIVLFLFFSIRHFPFTLSPFFFNSPSIQRKCANYKG